jgi:hypothetical protein
MVMKMSTTTETKTIRKWRDCQAVRLAVASIVEQTVVPLNKAALSCPREHAMQLKMHIILLATSRQKDMVVVRGAS